MKSQKNEISKKIKISKKKIKSQKKRNLKKKMKSQKKWNQKISEHSQCQCQIISEQKNRKWNLKEMKSQKK